MRDRHVERRCHLHDLIVLDVQRQRTADATVGANRVRHRLATLIPRSRFAAIVLRAEHQGTGRAHGDAIPAVHARRARKRYGELRRDARIEAAPGDGDRVRVLIVDAARLDALVAQNAFPVVADVQLVIDFDRLVDRRREVGVRWFMVTGVRGIPHPRGSRRCRRPIPLGMTLIAGDPLRRVRCRREVHGGREELEDHFPAMPHPG